MRIKAIIATGAGMVLAAGLSTVFPVGTSAAAEVRAAQGKAVTIKASATVIEIDQPIVLKGKVKSRRTTKVALEKRVAGQQKWKVEARGKVKKNGKYKFKDAPTTAQSRSYRVVALNGPRKKSPTVTVEVYAWQGVSHYEARARESMSWEYAVMVGGVDRGWGYVSARTKPSALMDFNLSGVCTAFRSTLGLSDDSDLGTKSTVKIELDGRAVFEKEFGLGQAEPVQIALGSSFRLALSTKSSNPDKPEDDQAGAVGAFIRPEMYCTTR